MKPTVHYIKLLTPFEEIQVGFPVILETHDHYSDLCSNREGVPVRTSRVVSINPEKASFETQNTVYRPFNKR